MENKDKIYISFNYYIKLSEIKEDRKNGKRENYQKVEKMDIVRFRIIPDMTKNISNSMFYTNI